MAGGDLGQLYRPRPAGRLAEARIGVNPSRGVWRVGAAASAQTGNPTPLTGRCDGGEVHVAWRRRRIGSLASRFESAGPPPRPTPPARRPWSGGRARPRVGGQGVPRAPTWPHGGGSAGGRGLPAGVDT